MQAIKVHGHIGADGILKLEIPSGLTNQDVEAVVVIQAVNLSAAPTDANGYPIGFIEATYGSLAHDPIERPDQGEFDVREPLE